MPSEQPHDTATIHTQFAQLQAQASSAGYSDYPQRRARLQALGRLIDEQEPAILAALHQDLGKSTFEAYLTEIALLRSEIRYTLKKLKAWLKPHKVASPLATAWSSSYIQRDPLGTVLVIAPWNYPFQLLAGPLIGALAGGNAVALKPSELAPATSALIAALIPRYFPAGEVQVIEGGQAQTTTLANLPFDHIFFTGSTRVGALIAAQAASNLTPVTLELGGKSPCVLLSEKNLDLAAKRIAWGKQLNSGQTCVAPDYLLLKKGLRARFVERYQYWITQFYGEHVLGSAALGKIVSPVHFQRLQQLLQGQQILYSAGVDSAQQKFGPTLVALDDARDASSPQSKNPLWEEEIFGPILPIVEVDNLEAALAVIAQKPKPLAAYLFSDNAQEKQRFVAQVRAGGQCINDVVVHLSNKHLPFGGVGHSGTGAYHGYHSFVAFTHPKAVMQRAFFIESSLRYLPAGNKLPLIKRLLPWLS